MNRRRCQGLISLAFCAAGLFGTAAAQAAVECTLTVPGLTAISDDSGGQNTVRGVFRCMRSSTSDADTVDFRINIDGTAATRRALYNGTDSSRVMVYDLYTDSARTQSWSATDVSGSRIWSGQLVFESQQLMAESPFPIYLGVTATSGRAGGYQQQLIGTATYTVDAATLQTITPVVTTISRSDVGCQVTLPPLDISLTYDLAERQDTTQEDSRTTRMRLACFDSGQPVKLELRRVGSVVGASHQILGLNYTVGFLDGRGYFIGALVNDLREGVLGAVVNLVSGLICLLGLCPNDLKEYELTIQASIPGGQIPDPAAMVGKCTEAGCSDLHTWEVVISY